jgi:gamma-glutamyl hydrolase
MQIISFPKCIKMMILCLLVIVGLVAGKNNGAVNSQLDNEGGDLLVDRPVIGILTQPYHHDHDRKYGTHDMVAASYVKWLESAGARSIPIPYDADDELVDEILTQVNGVLFPGGSAELPKSAHRVWQMAQQYNQNGTYFPIWGTCLGFEFMMMLAAKNGPSVIENGYKATNISLPLQYSHSSHDSIFWYSTENSKLYHNHKVRQILAEQNVAMNNHERGIEPKVFESDEGLTSLFRIVSTNVDLNGRPFVSTVESHVYPFYGVQFHPEKNAFEFSVYPNTNIPYEAINHSNDAIYICFALAEFFVQETRKNSSGRYNLVQRHPLIYSYEMRNSLDFEQTYIIPKADYWKNQNHIDFIPSASL